MTRTTPAPAEPTPQAAPAEPSVAHCPTAAPAPGRVRHPLGAVAADCLTGAGAGLLAVSLLWTLAPTAPASLAVCVLLVTAPGCAAGTGAARRWWCGSTGHGLTGHGPACPGDRRAGALQRTRAGASPASSARQAQETATVPAEPAA